jgi:DNA-3-methyladenine glycosylase I
VHHDQRLFEKLCLESFQSGLSWRTILEKRAHFRAAFHQFDFHRMARYTERDVQRLLGDAGIVRHRGKIEAVIHNAGRALDLVQEAGSLSAFVWSFAPAEPMPEADWAPRATSPESVALSKALKQRGWKFVGPTTAYAFMQSMGLVNDHFPGCAGRAPADQAIARLRQAD